MTPSQWGQIHSQPRPNAQHVFNAPLLFGASHFGTAAFDHDNVSPYACERSVGHSPQSLPDTDHAEPSLFMESKAGAVLWEYAGLDGPNAGSLSGMD